MTWKERARIRIQKIIDQNPDVDKATLKDIVSHEYINFNPWTTKRSGHIYKSWLAAAKEFGLNRTDKNPNRDHRNISARDLKNFWIEI